jgi:hypothetical protein
MTAEIILFAEHQYAARVAPDLQSVKTRPRRIEGLPATGAPPRSRGTMSLSLSDYGARVRPAAGHIIKIVIGTA